MKNILLNSKNFFFKGYFKFGIIAFLSYLIELLIYSYLILFFNIFYSNLCAAFIGISLDYIVSTSKKLNLFSADKNKKLKYYILYLIYITLLIISLSWLIEYLNEYINNPIISKVVVIPIGFTLNYFYFYIFMSKNNDKK